jgi:argininosuccinate lyase
MENKLWGGRFTGETDETFAKFNRSFEFDIRLFDADIRASLAHAKAIMSAGILKKSEFEKIEQGLRKLSQQASRSTDFFDDNEAEDVHSFIEARLVRLIGQTGKKLHAGRSRNDQVATAFRLWLRDKVDSIDDLLAGTQSALVRLAERHRHSIIPGYTHLQRAQPVLWAHWCLAYFEMLLRDRERLADARKRINVLPLGSAALAGSGFDINREAIANSLGFQGVTRNSLDAVSDRDFAVEFTSCCSLIMVHLSRLAEDLILYCSAEFGFIELSDAVSSGSSLMPQKKNPDALELLRGKAGRVFGHQMSLLAMMKGLPLAYNKDLQEDKEAVFDTADTIEISLTAAAIVLDNTSVNESRTSQAASTGYLNATEFADYLVKKGVPFRDAHESVGKSILFALGEKKELGELTLQQLRKFSKKIDADVFASLGLDQTVASKNVIGGTAPARVKAALAEAKRYLKNKNG